jgi:hypothetical protein
MLRLISAFALAIILAGCVTTSDVVPATRGAYVISAANGSWSNREQPRIRATRRASAYCANLNKTMVEEDFNESDFGFGFGDRYTLRFSCSLAAAAN